MNLNLEAGYFRLGGRNDSTMGALEKEGILTEDLIRALNKGERYTDNKEHKTRWLLSVVFLVAHLASSCGDNSILGPSEGRVCAGGKAPDQGGRIGCAQIPPELDASQGSQPVRQAPNQPGGLIIGGRPYDPSRSFVAPTVTADGKCPPGTQQRWFSSECY